VVGLRRATAAIIATWLLAHAGSADPEACRVAVRIDPPQAFIGQRVTWTAEIQRRPAVREVDWRAAPRFPGFRAEWMPSESQGRGTGRADWVVGRERRALYPARAGMHEIPPASLDCDGRLVEVPGVRIEVVAPPASGRPPEFTGLVGPVRVTTRVTPERIELGQSARLWVIVRGGGNVWAAAAPLLEDALPGVDVFPEPSSVDVDVDHRISLRHTFRYQLVPRREGVVRIPAPRYAWFDPESGRYRVSEGAARSLTVGGTAIIGGVAESAAGRAAVDFNADAAPRPEEIPSP
jgi:hypothetical protein